MDREIGQVNNKFSIKVVRDLNEFGKLKDMWNSLAESSESYTPWMSFDWFNLCLSHFPKWDKLLILVFYKGDNTIAIAPFVEKNEMYRGILKTKKIELLGSDYSPLRSIILGDIDQETKKSILSYIVHYFQHVYKSWNVIELDKVLGKDSFPNLFDGAIFNSGLKYRPYSCFNNWFLDGIDYNFRQFFEHLPKNLHRNVQRYEKKLKSVGELRFEMKINDEAIDCFLDLYDQIRAKSWKAIEKDKSFNREFLKYAAKKGWIRLSFLYIGGIPVAAGKYLVWDKTAFGIDAVYDQEYAKYSPGGVLTSKIFQYVIDIDKVTQIDLGRGDEPYKMEWVNNKREIKGITIFNQTLKGQFLAFLMTKALPIIEKNKNILAAKNRLIKYLKKYRQK
jgi:hypothetical protein